MSNLRAFTMPKWGIEMTEGTLADWMVAEGDAFEQGQLLAAIETDKIVNEVEADYAATCLRLVAEPGQDLPVGALLAVFGEAGVEAAEIDQFIAGFSGNEAYAGEPAAQQQSETPAETPTETVQPVPAATNNPAPAASKPAPAVSKPAPVALEIPEGVRLSAKALQAAQQAGTDLQSVSGSGNRGRILLQDVEQAGKPAMPARERAAIDNTVSVEPANLTRITPVALRLAEANDIDWSTVTGTGKNQRIRVRDLPLDIDHGDPFDLGLQAGDVKPVAFSRMRGHIAERLTRSQNEIPHYFLEVDVDANKLVAERERYNQSSDTHATVNDVVLLAVARSLAKHQRVNINVGDEEINYFADVNLAIAVSIDDGLIAPVVKQANTLNLPQMSVEARRLIHGARAGTLSLPDYGKGTFTVSNLGMHGIKRFTSIINPPQAAILSVGQIRRALQETADGPQFGWQLSLTMACDHRAIDGTIGTNMLESVKWQLQNPSGLFK